MIKLLLLSSILMCCLLTTGCALQTPKPSTTSCGTENPKPSAAVCPAGPAVMIAKYTATPIVLDGKLDDPIWKTAPVYPLHIGLDKLQTQGPLQEPGQVQLAWDDNYFYVGVKFTDSDVVAEGKLDQLHHYTMGDLAELFLKPADESWYWELYVTPANKKTSFWFPGRGRVGLPSGFDYTCGLKVAAHVQGTLNNWRDKDEYWTAEMAMPIKDLTVEGAKFGPGVDWRILVARYNYSRYLKTMGPELTSAPQLPITNNHYIEGYGKLVLEK